MNKQLPPPPRQFSPIQFPWTTPPCPTPPSITSPARFPRWRISNHITIIPQKTSIPQQKICPGWKLSRGKVSTTGIVHVRTALGWAGVKKGIFRVETSRGQVVQKPIFTLHFECVTLNCHCKCCVYVAWGGQTPAYNLLSLVYNYKYKHSRYNFNGMTCNFNSICCNLYSFITDD